MDIREYLKTKKIICDGAFGSYFTSFGTDCGLPEAANLEQPELVGQIHREYIEAGASFIRTNTFGIHAGMQEKSLEERKKYFEAGYQIAESEVLKAAKDGRTVFAAGDIGPIPPDAFLETKDLDALYRWTAETLIEAGAEILIFESFPDLEAIRNTLLEIKQKYGVFLIAQFCVNQYGYGSTGHSAAKLLEEAGKIKELDAVGFNCGIGPGHMLALYKKLVFPEGKYITALPNAGYPRYSRDRLVYMQNVGYFAERMCELAKEEADFAGGCCGTTPVFIKAAAEKFPVLREGERRVKTGFGKANESSGKDNAFFAGKAGTEKIIAAELAPPFDADIQKIMEAAHILKRQGVDVVTFPDSPSGRTRIDSVAMAVKIKNEVGLNVMPHICCRDKNSIAMTAQVLGAYINDVRNFLVITGDPVPVNMRSETKAVFNFNSVGMMQIIQEMNQSDFTGNEVVCGGALNCGCANMDVEIGKMKKKLMAGARFFFTQPVFNDRELMNLKLACAELQEWTEEQKPFYGKAKILCGLMPLTSYRNARFIKNEIAGINVSEEILAEFHPDMSREEAELTGIHICQRMVQKTWDYVDGYYFSIPFYRGYLVEKIMEKSIK